MEVKGYKQITEGALPTDMKTISHELSSIVPLLFAPEVQLKNKSPQSLEQGESNKRLQGTKPETLMSCLPPLQHGVTSLNLQVLKRYLLQSQTFSNYTVYI